LYVRSSFDVATKGFVTEYDFLNLVGEPLVKAKNPIYISRLQQLIPSFYLSSLRDAAQEFRARSAFWGPFVRSLDLDDQDRHELEAALAELNKKVLDNHAAFESVKERLEKTADLVPLGDKEPVSIEAVPSKIFDILSRTQVNLASKTGARIPIRRHGSGTQSLAVICLFDAFLQSQLEDSYDEHAQPLLALEEPEAHLHPSAVKAAGEMLCNLAGQKIISTHSGELLAGVPLMKIRRLRRKDGKICVYRLQEGILTTEEVNKLDYKIRTTRGSLLFSRFWLLVEGETEATLIGHDPTTLSPAATVI
jgi:putative ATP-dependent endonuclease of OLD family